MQTIRWFQMQPNTHVGLNTARPDSLRDDILRSLNTLGREYKVSFSDALLYMKADNWPADTPSAKADGVQQFQAQDFRVFAFIDNEPENLQGVAAIDPLQEILLLHADSIFQSKRASLPLRAIGGSDYDLTSLISKESLSQHSHFVWRGITDRDRLKQFLQSDVHWAEYEVQVNLMQPGPILGPVPATAQAARFGQIGQIALDDALSAVWRKGKGVKLNLTIGGSLLDHVLHRVDSYCFDGRIFGSQGISIALVPTVFVFCLAPIRGRSLSAPLIFWLRLSLMLRSGPGNC